MTLLFVVPSARARQVIAEPPASQPAVTQPASAEAQEPNPLPSPARMVQFFHDALEQARFDEAARCLNFAQVDEEVRRERATEYVTQLANILNRLEKEGHFDLATLEDDPAAPPQTIGKDPLLLTLERQEEPREGSRHRLWQFAASTVAGIPEMHDRLDELARLAEVEGPVPEASTPPEAGEEVNWLRSPYHLMEYFLVSVTNAKKDTAAYADAMNCLDFSLIESEDVEELGPDLADNLAAILALLRADGKFDRETLAKEPTPDIETVTIGSDPLLIIVVRQTDGCWRFSATTVKRIPDMIDAIEKRAEQEVEQGQTPVAPLATLTPRRDTSSPQATMNQFLSAISEYDLATAVDCFDLSRLTSETESSLAYPLAGKLLMVLYRHKVIVLQDVDSDPERAEPYTILKHTAGRIEIDRMRIGARAGEWLFTAETVRDIERLYEAFEKKPILPGYVGDRVSFWRLPALHVREYWVPTRFKYPLGGLQMWQWVGLGLILVIGLAVRALCAFLLPIASRRLLSTEGAAMLPRVLRKALLPTSTLVMLAAWWGGLQFLDLGGTVIGWTGRCLKIFTVVVGMLAIYRLLDVAAGYFSARAARTSSRLDDVLVPLMHKSGKVLVVALGFLFVAKAFGFQIGPLLAGFGLGGLAFGLAAQDTLKNFFGSVNVVLDRPFQVGDWVKVGDVEGTVESVGLRSSRLRTFYNSQITVPNSEIMNSRVDNMGRRRYRRISCKVSVTYSTTPDRLEAFCEGIRELIRKHPYTRKDYFHVYVNEFAASAINILLYCFHETPDWSTELRERHRLFLDIVRLANRLGVEFAFPTQTVHLHHESSPPADTPAPTSSPPSDTDGALRFGRDEAAAIVKQQFGDTIEKPPPVTF